MKRIVFYLLFFLFLIFLTKRTVLASTWIKYQDNPIISNNYRNPSVLYENGKYKIWADKLLTSQNQWVITYLESIDGVEWQEISQGGVLWPEVGNNIYEKNVYEPFVVKTDKYHIWYNSEDNNEIYKIRHAISIDGINWQKDPNYAIIGEKNWENKGVTHPTVLYYNNKYYLWYAGWGSSGSAWQLGLAISNDGITWQKHSNNPLSLPNNLGHVGGFYVEIKNNQFYIYYHTGGANATSIYYAVSDNGINWSCPNNDCLIITKNDGFESTMIISPHIVRNQNNTFLYYTGYDGSKWQIGLATEKPYTPTPNPTPSPTPKAKIVIIPGLFASWNKEAILHNKQVNYDEWILPSFVHEYDGLINTLKNLGFKKDKDFYIFAYDWRQPIEKTVENLNNFLTNIKSSTTNINIVGHSLGGLIGRIFTQKYPEKIKQIISVGSPHQGAIQVYKPLSAGEIDRENTFMWLAQKLILVLNKESFQSDRETLQKKFPVAFDLLPLFDFLKDENGQLISTNSMVLKNPTLPKFNFYFPQIYHQFTAIYGKNIDTPEYYHIEPPNFLDSFLGNYQDGHPVSLSKNNGDGIVLTKSGYEKDDSDNLLLNNFNHGEIIYKNGAIKKILEILNINYNENDVVEGKNTAISPSLIFLIRSPATMEVIDPKNNHYFEEDGIIFIENATSGNYQLLVKGKEKGNYQLIIGQIAENNDVWETINSSIISDGPVKEIDQYQINFSSQNATYQFPTSTPTPTATTKNSSNQSSQSSLNNQQANSNQSSISNNLKPTPTPSKKLISINRSLPEEKFINNTDNQPKSEKKGNVLGEKIKKTSANNSLLIFLGTTTSFSLLLFIFIYFKRETISQFYLKKSKRVFKKILSGR